MSSVHAGRVTVDRTFRNALSELDSFSGIRGVIVLRSSSEKFSHPPILHCECNLACQYVSCKIDTRQNTYETSQLRMEGLMDVLIEGIEIEFKLDEDENNF